MDFAMVQDHVITKKGVTLLLEFLHQLEAHSFLWNKLENYIILKIVNLSEVCLKL